MSFVRVFGTVTPSKPVAGVDVTVVSTGPSNVSDLQLVPGTSLFAWSPQVGDLGLVGDETWHFVNGMVTSEYDTVLVCDEDAPSPYYAKLWPVTQQQTVSWGMMEFGELDGTIRYDGFQHTVNRGAGISPHCTPRADQSLDIRTNGYSLLLLGIKGIHPAPPPFELVDSLGSVNESHIGNWAEVWAWHESWDDVLAHHEDWS